MTDRIQTKWSVYRLEANRGEFTQDLDSDCRTLEELLQVCSQSDPWTE